jgi:hypothetical protein
MFIRREYFIVYEKHSSLGNKVDIEERRVIQEGFNAEDAWREVSNKETKFNCLILKEIKRI